LMMYGLKPGPLLFVETEFVWTVIGSMYIGTYVIDSQSTTDKTLGENQHASL
jgi:TctA family transporter